MERLPLFRYAVWFKVVPMPMAVVGIVMKFFQIVISIVVGMAAESTALSMVREVVFGVGFALLPRFSGWMVCCTPCRCRIS